MLYLMKPNAHTVAKVHSLSCGLLGFLVRELPFQKVCF